MATFSITLAIFPVALNHQKNNITANLSPIPCWPAGIIGSQAASLPFLLPKARAISYSEGYFPVLLVS